MRKNPENPELNIPQETFSEGDIVVYDTSERNQVPVDETTRSAVHLLIEKTGPGPFRVKRVREFPSAPGQQILILETLDGRYIGHTNSIWMKKDTSK